MQLEPEPRSTNTKRSQKSGITLCANPQTTSEIILTTNQRGPYYKFTYTLAKKLKHACTHARSHTHAQNHIQKHTHAHTRI